jgi:hypothetical protein
MRMTRLVLQVTRRSIFPLLALGLNAQSPYTRLANNHDPEHNITKDIIPHPLSLYRSDLFTFGIEEVRGAFARDFGCLIDFLLIV